MAKEFDDSLFEETEYNEDLFEDKEFDDSLFEDEPTMSAWEGGLEGAKSGATFGFSDELAGLHGAALEYRHEDSRRKGALEFADREDLIDDSSEEALKHLTPEARALAKKHGIDASIPGADIKPTFSELYRESRDAQRERQERAEKEQPGAYLAGEIAGGMLIPGGSAAKAKKAGESMTKAAAKSGALVGGLEGAGRTEADLGSAEGVIDVGASAATGAALGGTIGKIGSKFMKSGDELVEAAEETAEEAGTAALKGIGATAADMGEELGIKTSKKVKRKGTGTTLLEEGVIQTKQTPKEIKKAIESKMDEVYTQRLVPFAKQADELIQREGIESIDELSQNFKTAMGLEVDDIMGEVIDIDRVDVQKLYEEMSTSSVKISDLIDNALKSENPISSLIEIKRKIQSRVNWEGDYSAKFNQFFIRAQSKVSNLINDIVAESAPELANKMKKANKTYGNLTRANYIAGEAYKKAEAKTGGVGWKDYLVGGVATGVTGQKWAGPALIAGKQILESATGKETGRLMNTIEALHKFQKAKKLAERAANAPPDSIIRQSVSDIFKEGADLTTQTAIVAGAPVIDTEGVDAPYQNQKKMTKLLNESSSEEIQQLADKIRNEQGDAGEKLASTLEKINQRDRHGKRALLYGLMQDPNNRRMLGLE